MITLSRRKLLTGLGLLIAAPALVKASSLMPVKAYKEEPLYPGIRFQTWPFNENHPSVEVGYAEGSQGTSRTKLRPLSYWQNEVRRYERMGYPIYWQPIEPLHADQPVVLR